MGASNDVNGRRVPPHVRAMISAATLPTTSPDAATAIAAPIGLGDELQVRTTVATAKARAPAIPGEHVPESVTHDRVLALLASWRTSNRR